MWRGIDRGTKASNQPQSTGHVGGHHRIVGVIVQALIIVPRQTQTMEEPLPSSPPKSMRSKHTTKTYTMVRGCDPSQCHWEHESGGNNILLVPPWWFQSRAQDHARVDEAVSRQLGSRSSRAVSLVIVRVLLPLVARV